MNKLQVFNLNIPVVCSSALLAAAFFSGCAARQNIDVARVQDELAVLKSDPVVISDSSTELQEAEQAVSRASDSWTTTHDADEAGHLAYLADERIQIARLKTNQHLAENDASRLSQARDQAAADAHVRAGEQAEARASMAAAVAVTYQAMSAERQAQIDDLKGQLNDLKAQQSERGLTLTLGDVLFENNRAALKSGATRKLSPLVTYLRQHPQEVLAIEGHTDNVGTASSNLDLSSRRAQAVRYFLIEEGVAPERLSTRGLGEEYPVASNTTESGRLQNRRVEIIISNRARTVDASN